MTQMSNVLYVVSPHKDTIREMTVATLVRANAWRARHDWPLLDGCSTRQAAATIIILRAQKDVAEAKAKLKRCYARLDKLQRKFSQETHAAR